MVVSQTRKKPGGKDTPVLKGDILRITFGTRVLSRDTVVLPSDDEKARSTLLGEYVRGGDGRPYVIAGARWPVDDNFSGLYRVTQETVLVPLTHIEHVSRVGPGKHKPANEPPQTD
ncbi:MAG: hypothetical protein U1C52_01120 [Patescibacteria group bacterium]|nr:hypothetical protein [Patescibacteria group bacterium]